jgi:hypothetical protein
MVVGSRRADEVDVVPAHLARRGVGHDRIAHDGAQQDQVAAGLAQLGQRRGEVLVGRLVRGGFDELDAELLGLLFGALQDLLAEIGVLVHDADGLLALLLHEVVGGRADLVDVGRRAVELQPVERLEHRARCREREQVGHVGGELVLEAGVVHRRAQRRHEREHVVAVDQLVAGLHRLRHLVALILDDQADPAPVEAAGLVDVLEPHLHAVRRGDAVRGGDAGEIGVHAERDLGLRHPARLCRRACCRGRQRGGHYHYYFPTHHPFPFLSWKNFDRPPTSSP